MSTATTLWCLVLCVAGLLQGCSSLSYRAAVLEFMPELSNAQRPVSRHEALRVIYNNINYIQTFVANASLSGAQIIVTPEYGLFGPRFTTRDEVAPFLEPIPEPNSIPCMHVDDPNFSAPASARLSCIAKKYNIVLVVDMGDRVACSNVTGACPSDGRFQFNTAVAFGVNGAILQKYWKTNLYYEPFYDPAPQSQGPKYFDTHFGVRFGLFICFDILFADPQLNLLKGHGITDIAYPTWWVNTPPLMTATQMQRGWSAGLEANLLAANSGSDVPVLRNVVEANHSDARAQGSSAPPPPATATIDAHAVPLPRESLAGTIRAEVESVKCSIAYKISSVSASSTDNFQVFASNGYLTPLFDSTVCGLTHCRHGSKCISLIGKDPTLVSTTVFDFVRIEMELIESSTRTYAFPLAASSGALDLSNENFLFQRNSNKFIFETGNLKLNATLLNAAILVRNL